MSRQFTLAVAEAMPVEKYGFKVSEEEMSFAALMIHIATSNAFRFAQIAGKPMPLAIPESIPKVEAKNIVKKLLADSFDYCMAQLDRFTPAQMDQLYKVDWFERERVTGRRLVLGMFVHTAHHRGQARGLPAGQRHQTGGVSFLTFAGLSSSARTRSRAQGLRYRRSRQSLRDPPRALSRDRQTREPPRIRHQIIGPHQAGRTAKCSRAVETNSSLMPSGSTRPPHN